MRVLMTADTVGGVWTYALELAEALRDDKVQVALATMGAPLSDVQRADAGRLPNVTLYESRYQLEWMESPWDDVERAGVWLLELERRLAPDVVHLNGYTHAALPWNAPTLVVAHSDVLSWWRAVRREPAPSRWERYRIAVRQGLNAADLVVAPTRAMLDALREEYGPTPRSRVIGNARRAEPYRPGRKRPCVLAAGRLWDEAKNVAALCAVAAELPWPVFVAGDTRSPDGKYLELAGVRHLGHLSAEQLAAWLAQTEIFVLPARYEPFGLSVLEAGLSGCALVLGAIPSLQEVWGDAAVFVPPDDHACLLATLRRLTRDEALRRELGMSARERALRFTPSRFAHDYVEAYRRMIRDRSRTAEAMACVS